MFELIRVQSDKIEKFFNVIYLILYLQNHAEDWVSMKNITDKELLELYLDTLNKCGVYLLDEDDATIEYAIYEEFDIGVNSFLHINSLKKLYDKELISIDKLNLSILLRTKVMELQNSDEWDFVNFRTSKKWKEIMVLADKIKAIN